MNKVFRIRDYFCVPDGTFVSPFLNSKDNQSGLPFDLLGGFSLAAGKIETDSKSKIHIMPHVTQVTFVREGKLEVMMKSDEGEPYPLNLERNEAVLSKPGTFFQLINNCLEPCEVLYIVSPAYLYEKSGDTVLYDDSVVLEEDWEQLSMPGWKPKENLPTLVQRKNAEDRLAGRRR